MPYRAAIESVIARCAELRVRIEKLQHVPVPDERCESIEEALAWEARLRAIVSTLEARRAAADYSPTVMTTSDGEGTMTTHVPVLVAIAAIIGGICIAAAIVAAMTTAPRQTSARSYALFSGTVTRSSPRSEERCTIQVDRSEDGCDVDVVCPAFESRLKQQSCELEARMSFTTAEAGRIDIELDAWR